MFTNLGFKTDYSLLKSLIKLEDLFKYAEKYNIKTLGILDDNLCSSHMFIEECKKRNIKPIVGLDTYINDIRIYLYPININGLKFLFKYLNDEIKLDEISDVIGVIPFESINYYDDFKGIFNELYVSFSSEKERLIEEKKYKNIIYIKEIKAFNKESSKYINYLNMIDKGLRLGEYEFINYGDYVLSNEEYDVSDFVNKFNLEFNKSKNHIPTFGKNNSYEYLKEIATKGLSKRLNGKVSSEYKDRLEYELSIINKMGFVDYFLIVFDYVRYALKNNIMVGCGRGSAVGSLVAYSLGITWIDPLKYNLLFERFLNPERITMPDIDIDFEDTRRDEVVDYVINKYGQNKVSHIMTYNTLTAKEVLRTVARIDVVDDSTIESLTKLIDSKKSLKDNLTDEVKALLKRNSSLRKVYEEARYLEGIKKNIGTHAAGIVISDVNLTESIPVIKSGDTILSGFTAPELESLGLLKMDFLSLSNLTVIKNTLKLVEDYEGIKININSISLDEKGVYELLSSGNTNGIFQFDTPMMKNYLRKAKPNEFKDLIMALAINRPGPMSNIPTYLARKNEGRKVSYLIPDLEKVLSETYGLMIYQEEVMEVLRLLAGYSYGEADVIRRAISKKKLEVIEKERINFVDRAIKNGFEKEKLEKVYDQIVEFAGYGFNKSHSVAYSMISYQMAYLKYKYPGYFYLTLLNQGGKKELIINEAKTTGIEIKKPDVNISSDMYEYKDNSIILAFKSIKGITDSISKMIVDARGNTEFKDIYDFFGRVKGINKKILTLLAEGGIFDSLNINRATVIRNLDSLMTYGELIQTLSKELVSEPELITVDEFSDVDLMNKELELFGFYVCNHPCSKFNGIKQIDIRKYFDKYIEMNVLVKRISKIKTKKNDDMAFVTYEDETGVGEALVFSEVFNQLDNINVNDIIKINGHVERRLDKFQLIIKKIEKI